MDLEYGSAALLVAVSFLVLVITYGFHPLKRWQLRHIPGPPPRWYAGNLPDVIKDSTFWYYISNARKYGKVFKLFFGATPVIVVTDAELGRAINLRNPNRHDAMSPVMLMSAKERDWDTEGILLTKDRAFHRSIRNAWQPSMFTESLEGYSEVMNRACDRLIRRLGRAAAKRQELDMFRVLGNLTMDVVGTTSFGVEFRTQEDDADPSASEEGKKLVAAAQAFFQLFSAQGSVYMPFAVFCPPLIPLLRPIATAFPDKNMRQLKEARDTLRNACRRLLQRVRDADADQAAAEATGAKSGSKRYVAPGSFMHHIAHSKHHPSFADGAPLRDSEVMQQAFTFLLGGYETTASALAFAVYLLSANPDKAARLGQELDAFGRDRVPKNADLEQLPYVTACFREALRLYPPGHISIREAAEDLNLDGKLVKKGTWLHVSICGIHRDPDVWSGADEYIPERWIEGAPEAATEAQKKAFMPFGDGARSCVGKRFAWEEALIALIRIYQRFDFTLSPGQIPLAVRSPFTLGPSKGIMLTPVLRHEE